MKAQKLNQRQACQALYLLRFDFTLKYILRIKIEKADRLSKRLYWKVDIKKDNENKVFIKDCWLCNLHEVVIEGPEVKIVEKNRSKDKEVIRVVEEMKKAKVKVVREDEQQMEGELVLKENKVYVPKDEKLRAAIFQLHYNISVAGDREKQKMTELVTRNYWWLGVMRDVGRYVEGCNMCQRIKNRIEVIIEKLKLSEVVEKPQTYLMVDFIMKLLLVARKNMILVICNRLSKMTHFVATTEETSAEGLVELFRDNVQKLHGFLEDIVSDCQVQFTLGWKSVK